MDKERIIEFLLISYKDRFKTMSLFEDRYNEKIKYIFLYITGIAGIVAILNSLGITNSSIIDLVPSIIIFILILSMLSLPFFLIGLMMNDLYYIYMNSVGMKIIEEELNNIIGLEIFVWNSKIFLRHFYNPKEWAKNIWIKPNYLMALFTILIVGFAEVLFGIICYNFADKYFYPYVIFASLLTVFFIIQWSKLHGVGIDYLEDKISFPRKTKEILATFRLSKTEKE